MGVSVYYFYKGKSTKSDDELEWNAIQTLRRIYGLVDGNLKWLERKGWGK